MARGPLSRNVVLNMLNAGATIGAAVLSVPLILYYVGADGYGVWVLAQTAVIYVATAETGFGPAVQRYVSVAHGAMDARGTARVVWSATGVYVVLGAVIAVIVALLAPAVVRLFDVPAALRDDAETMFRLMGPVMLLALIAAGLANVLQGVERFAAAAWATVLSYAVFLAAAAALLVAGHGLVGLAEAAMVQYAVGMIVRVWMVRDLLAVAPFARVSPAEARGLVSFSARMQVNVLSTLINSQTDKVIVGLITTTAVVGEVGIGSQVAEAGRFLAFAALGPMLARMAIAHGERDPAHLANLYRQLNGVWLPGAAGLTVLGCAVMYPLITGWLGSGHRDAALYGALLTLAYGVNALTGPGVAYLRAVGRPGLEARYGSLVILLNVAGTVALGLLFGPTGVVSATAIAYVIGTVWFFRRLPSQVPAAPAPQHGVGLRIVVACLLAAGAGLAWGLLAVAILPPGFALVLVGAGAAAAGVGYLSVVTGVRPTRARVRALLG
jgi:O-antigen/teichoic acid export membrane protein